jgi:hypothetical protein
MLESIPFWRRMTASCLCPRCAAQWRQVFPWPSTLLMLGARSPFNYQHILFITWIINNSVTLRHKTIRINKLNIFCTIKASSREYRHVLTYKLKSYEVITFNKLYSNTCHLKKFEKLRTHQMMQTLRGYKANTTQS